MKKLYLGVAREVITPPIGSQMYGYRPDIFSESVADDLTATAFYFQQGDARALMISCTVASVGNEVAQPLLKKIAERFGIPVERCMLCATHTHSGPCLTNHVGWGGLDQPYHDNIFVPGVLAAVEAAMKNPVPVTMGCAEGESFVGVNRRELTPKNTITFGQNPWGCFNPRMTVISFRDEAGTVVANMIHYGAHATSAGHNHEITRDWPGVMTDRLEKETGGITAFFNGPEGDVGPRLSNGKTIGDLSHVYELGAVAAQDAVRIYRSITGYRIPELRAGSGFCRIPMKSRMTREQAEALYENNKEKTVNIGAMMKNTALAVLRAYEQGEPEQTEFACPQNIVMLGENVFVGFPYELFSEIGLRIDKAFPDARVLSVVNTNGSRGYFITQDAICRGGYEVNYYLYGNVQSYCEDADWHLIRETVENLNTIIMEV